MWRIPDARFMDFTPGTAGVGFCDSVTFCSDAYDAHVFTRTTGSRSAAKSGCAFPNLWGSAIVAFVTTI